MAEAWSDIEIEHTLNAYADMLRMENEGKYYVKADVVRRTQQSVHRSSKAIQFKFCNISAILSEMGYP